MLCYLVSIYESKQSYKLLDYYPKWCRLDTDGHNRSIFITMIDWCHVDTKRDMFELYCHHGATLYMVKLGKAEHVDPKTTKQTAHIVLLD